MTFTAQQKLECVEREIKMRRRVYPRWIADGRMTQARADHEIAVMEAVVSDYAAIAQKDRLL